MFMCLFSLKYSLEAILISCVTSGLMKQTLSENSLYFTRSKYLKWQNLYQINYLFFENVLTILANTFPLTTRVANKKDVKTWQYVVMVIIVLLYLPNVQETKCSSVLGDRRSTMEQALFQAQYTLYALADLGGGVRDARPPLGVQILSISCSFRENLACSRPPWRVHAPPSGKSWIRHWYVNKQFIISHGPITISSLN